MLGLRRPTGAQLCELQVGLLPEQKASLTQEIGQLKDKALLKENNGVIRLTPDGMVVENEVAARLCRSRERSVAVGN